MSKPRILVHERGITLIEAMVALVVMAFGMVALAGLQGNIRRSADIAKQRGEAVRMSQQDIENLRAFSQIGAATPEAAASGVQGFAGIATQTSAETTNTNFTLTRTVVNLDAQYWLTSISSRVDWKDRAGADTTLQMDTLVGANDPSLGAFLSQPSEGAPARRPLERSAQIPVSAKDLGNGGSVFRPVNGASLIWVFNNLTGMITNKCNVEKAIADISKDDVIGCSVVTAGYYLSGFVRFSTGVSADPENPSSPALPLDMQLQVVDSSQYLTPAFECFDDAPGVVGAQSVVAYYCIVYPNSAVLNTWSGRLNLTGIPLGDGNYRICRYSADYDGIGGVDKNEEHPADYVKVAGPLTRQNFLVVSNANSCPAGQAADPANGRYVNTATVDHQHL
ncbi:prepilin-type N-terminal cleavage/methylation domain-containing protein [Paucibacter sediminis]|uniref:Prepilin-type N-terminal cleavage/methylation domain-containing protein n=1 Tax=Paucibacter sediminis TaxID=3019553 RepID=A0AA95SUX8_9BURK|nr:prepilin-type N-terminal cleavage/methylation domain-containing protein [Paucibacter sp. S2-9]WIT11014.1 prepilin-type N-terminal cleavage/methylation domain-containing protein [Paucibacter sp. S2-9]